MGKALDKAAARAIEDAPLTLAELAEAVGVHFTLLQKIRDGDRAATPEVAATLAKVIRRRTKRLATLADQLEAEVRAERKRRR